MNIIVRELRASWKSLLFWVLGMLALLGSGISKYEGLSTSGVAMEQILALYPKSLKALFGMGSYNVGEPMGYFGVIYVFVQVLGGLHAVMLGSHIVGKEERDKTAEFLMTKPVDRAGIFKLKMIAAAGFLLVVNLVVWGISSPMLAKYVDSVNSQLAGIQLSFFAFQLLFMTFGATLSAISGSPKTGQYAVFVFFGCYFLKFVSDVMGGSFLDYVTPFSFLGAQHVILEGNTPVWGCLAAFALSGGMLYASMRMYPKRDLNC